MRKKDINRSLKTFGRTVRDLRKNRGFTQEQLGEICERHPVYISEIERGIKSPSLVTILKLCDALEITPGELMEVAFQPGSEIKKQIMMKLSNLKGKDLERVQRIVEAI